MPDADAGAMGPDARASADAAANATSGSLSRSALMSCGRADTRSAVDVVVLVSPLGLDEDEAQSKSVATWISGPWKVAGVDG